MEEARAERYYGFRGGSEEDSSAKVREKNESYKIS